MAESIDITDHFEGYITSEENEPWDGTYPAELEGESGTWQIISEVMYVVSELGNPCRIRTWTSHINSGAYQLPDEIVDMFDDYNMEFADAVDMEGSGMIQAIAISDPGGAISYAEGAIEPVCRSVDVTGTSRGNFGVSVIKVA